ncbi:substrate-binding domain-containing protein [Paenibacillus turpanensis]|uniref:substrate-binding domain-containing protein n=1 Tax=Paenibacillus turpanensis TaxID=2689078 RepID=UPI001407229E|nr:substrate-binding domain-containing protein [Paenibacillus turpanensis]
MKKILFVYVTLAACFLLYFFQYHFRDHSDDAWSQQGLRGEIEEKYVMVTFQSGIDYWKSCLKGFEDAAQALNVSIEYRGATQYDVHEQITVLEQIIAKKPAGIAISAINPGALTDTIDKAVEAGIPVVLFDSGAPESNAYSFLATDNYNAGVKAAHEMASLLGGSGKTAVLTLPNQQNHQERTRGYLDTVRKHYPELKVVAVKDGKGDSLQSKLTAIEIASEHPDVDGIFATEANGGVGVGEAVQLLPADERYKIISFDTDKGTLDLVKNGVISATLAQGTWNMGYWSLQFLFHLHHGISQSGGGGFSGDTPLPRYVDTGITVVTRANVEHYYAK